MSCEIGRTSASNCQCRCAEVIGVAQFLCSVPDSQGRYAEEAAVLALACIFNMRVLISVVYA